MTAAADALHRLEERLNWICCDSLDIPLTFGDGSTALAVQTAEMGEVSAWFEEAREALATVRNELQRLREERDEALRGNWKREPSDEGGNGHEETYWLRNKLRSAVVHLRDIEDFYIVLGGTPESYNVQRAQRARGIHEQISEDFINGKLSRATMRERAETAEAEVQRLTEGLRGLKEEAHSGPPEDRSVRIISFRELNERIDALLADSPDRAKPRPADDPHSLVAKALLPDGAK